MGKSRIQEVQEAVSGLYGGGAVAGAGRFLVCESTSIEEALASLGASVRGVEACVSRSYLASVLQSVRKYTDEQLEKILRPSREAAAVRDRLIGELLGEARECIILKSARRNSWQMILPDVAGGGRWRTQAFDDRGFVGHSVHNSQKDALEEAVGSGYVERDDEALNRLQDTPAFVRGNYLSELVRLVNMKALTMDQANEQMAQYDRGQLLCSEIAAGLAQAFYEPMSDTIVLVADRIEPGTEQAVYLHEVVHKHGPWILGDSYGRLIDRVAGWGRRDPSTPERQVFEVAHAAAMDAYRARLEFDEVQAQRVYRHELLAYAVEAAVAAGIRPRAGLAGAQQGDDVEGWLSDVISTLKGLRMQLLGQGAGDIELEDIVSMAHALAQVDNPERVQQVIEALEGGGEQELAQIIRQRTDILSVELGAGRLLGAVRQVYHENDFWEEMVGRSQFRAGPFDGGCLTCALAIQDVAGGRLVGIGNARGLVEHYGVMVGGLIYDFGGAHASLKAWVKSLDTDLDANGTYHLVEGRPAGCQVVLDEGARHELVGLLRRALLDQDPTGPVCVARARAEGALIELGLPIIGDQQMALWRESQDILRGDADDVLLEGWLLKSRTDAGQFEFVKEFYVSDDSGETYALWHEARASVGEQVVLRVIDGSGAAVPVEQAA